MSKYVVQIANSNKSGRANFLIESGYTAYIFITTEHAEKARKFIDSTSAEFFIKQFPEKRRKRFKVVSMLDLSRALKAA